MSILLLAHFIILLLSNCSTSWSSWKWLKATIFKSYINTRTETSKTYWTCKCRSWKVRRYTKASLFFFVEPSHLQVFMATGRIDFCPVIYLFCCCTTAIISSIISQPKNCRIFLTSAPKQQCWSDKALWQYSVTPTVHTTLLLKYEYKHLH